jgi:hypothetical protein
MYITNLNAVSMNFWGADMNGVVNLLRLSILPLLIENLTS